MNLPIIMLMPIIAGVYGGFLGAYIHSKDKSPKYKLALYIAGVVILILAFKKS